MCLWETLSITWVFKRRSECEKKSFQSRNMKKWIFYVSAVVFFLSLFLIGYFWSNCPKTSFGQCWFFFVDFWDTKFSFSAFFYWIMEYFFEVISIILNVISMDIATCSPEFHKRLLSNAIMCLSAFSSLVLSTLARLFLCFVLRKLTNVTNFELIRVKPMNVLDVS